MRKLALRRTYESEPYTKLELVCCDSWAHIDEIDCPIEKICEIDTSSLPTGAGIGGAIDITPDEWISLVRKYEPGPLPEKLNCERPGGVHS